MIRVCILSALLLAILVPCLQADIIFAVTTSNQLISFSSAAPGQILSSSPITGLQAGETLLTLDFRPKTAELYGIGATSRVYKIDTTTGVATAVSATPFTPGLSGVDFGSDFNPTVDRLRVVSDNNQNFRADPTTGAVLGAGDTLLFYDPSDSNTGQDPNIIASAYTNNYFGAAVTTLYGIDSTLDILARQGGVDGAAPSANSGRLFTIGALGVDTTSVAGFDISPNGTAFASLNSPSDTSSKLYTVDLSTGAASLLGTIGGPDAMRDIAVLVFSPPDLFSEDLGNNLIRFSSAAPGTNKSSVPITGLQASENILGIDFRPSTGELFGVGSTSRLYTIDTTSGAATVVGAQFSPLLSGTVFGVDFSATADRLRVVSSSDQNLRLNPISGAATVDTTLAYDAGDPNSAANPSVAGLAYDNSFPGATTATAYGVDESLRNLVTVGGPDGAPSANGGILFTIGTLNIATAIGSSGFDILPTGAAFAVFSDPSLNFTLYTVNLTTGDTASVGLLSGAVRATAAAPAGQPQFSAVTTSVNEDAGTMPITVNRTGGTYGTISVDYAATNGTATAGADYTATAGTLIFNEGETSKMILVPIINDNLDEPDETINLTLSYPSGGATLTTPNTAVATIVDNDVALLSDDFEDGAFTWDVLSGDWQESGGTLFNTGTKGKIFAPLPWSPSGASTCTTCTIEVDMQSGAAFSNKVFLEAWFQDNSNKVELILKEDLDKWILKQRAGNAIVAKGKFITGVINPNQMYHVVLSFDGTNFQVTVDGVPIITLAAAATPSGNVGFKVKNTVGTFAGILVY